MTTKKGFTLIELMFVFIIIAILSVIGLVLYLEVQKGVRDSKRKQDLSLIQHGLTVYYQRNGRFPCTEDWQTSSDSSPWLKDLGVSNAGCGGVVTDFDTNYINALPADPKQTFGFPWNVGQYSYIYWAGSTEGEGGSCPGKSGQYYIMVVKLERRNDRDRAANTPYYFCNGLDEIIGRVDLIPGDDIENLYIVTSQD